MTAPREGVSQARARQTEVLLADIGGTHARFALWRNGGISESTISYVRDYPSPAAAIGSYLSERGIDQPELAVLAVAGPVDCGRACLTNAAWTFDERDLEQACGIRRVLLVNDFAAQAWALPGLTAEDLEPLDGGPPVDGATKLVLGPGTGLGLAAYLPPLGPEPDRVVTGEGGHALLAAETEQEARLLATLRIRFGRVSAERVLCGDGLLALAEALPSGTRFENSRALIAAARGGNAAAQRALEQFCAFLGTFAGDMALAFGARGGVYLAGGLPPALSQELKTSDFRSRFEAKGRFQEYMQAIPVWVVRHPNAAFVGLARIAEKHLAH